MKVTRIGLDIAKTVFQVHGVDEHGKVVLRKTLKRDKVTEFFANLPPCLIGIEACGKPASYDPQKDASVRVQVGRLRGKLEDYYAAEGVADPIILELPKGRFSLQFRTRSVAEPAATPQGRVAVLLDRFRRVAPAEAVLAALLAGGD